jgi:hypothetical protein
LDDGTGHTRAGGIVFIDAVNRHDETTFPDAFSEYGVVGDGGPSFGGRDKIKPQSDTDFIGSCGAPIPEHVAVAGYTVSGR